MRKVAGEHPFCVLTYMNSYIFHIYFVSFVLLSHLIFDWVCLTLPLADSHGIAKYARTYIWDMHTHAHTQFFFKKSSKTRKKRNRGEDQERKKEGKEKGRKEKGGNAGGK